MRKYRSLYLDIPLVIIGGLIIHRELATDGCLSLNGMIFFIMLKYLFALTFLIIITIDVVRLIKSRTFPNLLAVIVTMVILPMVVLALMLPKDVFESEIKIYATLKMGWKGSLTLREDNSYSVRYSNPEVTCYYSGNYLIKNDTLVLDTEIPEETGNVFYCKYLFRSEYKLIPMDILNHLIADTTTWLTIESKEKHKVWR